MSEEIETEQTEEGGFEQFDIVRVMMIFLAALNEIIDWATALLNVTGVWIAIPLALNILFTILILCLRVIKDGFTLKAVVCGWQQALALILEYIPVVGDIVPGFIGWILLGDKKKKGAEKNIAIKTKTE